MTTADEGLLDLSLDYWRLLRAFRGLAARVPPDHAEQALAQLRFAEGRLERVLEAAGVRAVTFEGRAYEPGLPVTVVNAEDHGDAAGASLRVAQTLEPALVADGCVLRLGKVIVEAGE